MKNKRWDFIVRAILSETDECILWPWGTHAGGYGCVGHKKKGVHVLVCRNVHGEKPSNKDEVAHSCGVRRCINKRHLRWATKAENAADRLMHGTHNRGDKGGLTKLTKEQVIEIRSGKRSQADLAREFGVTRATINDAKNGRTWAWI